VLEAISKLNLKVAKITFLLPYTCQLTAILYRQYYENTFETTCKTSFHVQFLTRLITLKARTLQEHLINAKTSGVGTNFGVGDRRGATRSVEARMPEGPRAGVVFVGMG